jgi:hypothetical protein
MNNNTRMMLWPSAIQLTRYLHHVRGLYSSAQACHAKMVDLNWARDELEERLSYWRSLANSDESVDRACIVDVNPRLIVIRGSPGLSKVIAASADSIDPSLIRARFDSKSLVTILRLASQGSMARFSISVKDEFRSRNADPRQEIIRITAPGAAAAEVFVILTPLLAQEYDGRRIVPTRDVIKEAVVSFGKHKGRTFEEVARDDPSYLSWVISREVGTVTERECADLALKASGKRGRSAA